MKRPSLFIFFILLMSLKAYSQPGTLKEIPLQIGVEIGPTIPIAGKNVFPFVFNGYLNFNISSNRSVFARLEYGYLKLNDELGKGTKYGALLISYTPWITKKHKLFFNAGFGLAAVKGSGIGGLYIGIQYIYYLTRHLGVSTGIKIPVLRESLYNEYFYNPSLTIGLQLF